MVIVCLKDNEEVRNKPLQQAVMFSQNSEIQVCANCGLDSENLEWSNSHKIEENNENE